MNDQTDLIGLEMKVITTTTGKKFLAFEHGDKHYKAWINVSEERGNDGRVWKKEWATVKLCDYNNCKRCENGIVSNEIL